MIDRKLIAGLFFAAFVTVAQNASAGDYVWARSQFTQGPNRPVSAMGNGYGGYYVPRNAYGNNYEGRRITNPNGYIIPAQQPQGRRFARYR